jgi:hypothetical protein
MEIKIRKQLPYCISNFEKIRKNFISKFTVIFSLIACGFACTNQKKDNIMANNIIYFDSGKSIDKFDMKDITDTTFQIIPLETTDDCLIANIDKLEMRNNHIYVMDRLAQSVYMFDMTGKYLNKIDSRGQGPEEYAFLSNMTVTDNSVIVIDHITGKQLEYSVPDLKFIREERIFEKILAEELFTVAGTIYYVNDYSDDAGKFRLFSRKTDAKDFTKYMPCEEFSLGQGIDGTKYAITGNEASLIYSGSDTIYRIRENKIFPEYVVKFKDKIVEDIFSDNLAGRVEGIKSIYESDKYLFIEISMTTKKNTFLGPGNYGIYTCLYNKSDHTTIIYPWVCNSIFDDNIFFSLNFIIDNKIIFWIEAHMFIKRSFSEEQLSKQPLKNKAYENRLRSVLANLKEDDNPVLTIYNLK